MQPQQQPGLVPGAPPAPPGQYGPVYNQPGQQFDPIVPAQPYPPPPYEPSSKMGMPPAQPAMAPMQPGMYAGQPGMAPGQPGMAPGQPGMIPGQPGMIPGQPGMVPGVITDQPGQPGQPLQTRPNDYLIQSIMSMFLCLPLGIAATFFACKSRHSSKRRDFQAAKSSSITAKRYMSTALSRESSKRRDFQAALASSVKAKRYFFAALACSVMIIILNVNYRDSWYIDDHPPVSHVNHTMM